MNCPTCGSVVSVLTGDEGTSTYWPVGEDVYAAATALVRTPPNDRKLNAAVIERLVAAVRRYEEAQS